MAQRQVAVQRVDNRSSSQGSLAGAMCRFWREDIQLYGHSSISPNWNAACTEPIRTDNTYEKNLKPLLVSIVAVLTAAESGCTGRWRRNGRRSSVDGRGGFGCLGKGRVGT